MRRDFTEPQRRVSDKYLPGGVMQLRGGGAGVRGGSLDSNRLGS